MHKYMDSGMNMSQDQESEELFTVNNKVTDRLEELERELETTRHRACKLLTRKELDEYKLKCVLHKLEEYLKCTNKMDQIEIN